MGYITKKQREEIKKKFDGLCAYSGTPLEDDWQVDHIKPLVRNWFDGTPIFPDAHCDENLVPCQKIINHYKGSLDLETFRTWLLGGLHERINKPKNPRTEKSKRKKEYLNKVALYFGITPTKPFKGTFYFESLKKENATNPTLFDIKQAPEGLTCHSCEHRQRWQCNSKVIQYCGIRKSNRTENGLLKIKCKDAACPLYEPCH